MEGLDMTCQVSSTRMCISAPRNKLYKLHMCSVSSLVACAVIHSVCQMSKDGMVSDDRVYAGGKVWLEARMSRIEDWVRGGGCSRALEALRMRVCGVGRDRAYCPYVGSHVARCLVRGCEFRGADIQDGHDEDGSLGE
jgi:hypothetical protein